MSIDDYSTTSTGDVEAPPSPSVSALAETTRDDDVVVLTPAVVNFADASTLMEPTTPAVIQKPADKNDGATSTTPQDNICIHIWFAIYIALVILMFVWPPLLARSEANNPNGLEVMISALMIIIFVGGAAAILSIILSILVAAMWRRYSVKTRVAGLLPIVITVVIIIVFCIMVSLAEVEVVDGSDTSAWANCDKFTGDGCPYDDDATLSARRRLLQSLTKETPKLSFY